MPNDFSLTDPLIQRDPPNAIIYNLAHPTHTTITLPTRSTWTSGLHWHEHHTEYLRVVRGTIHLTTLASNNSNNNNNNSDTSHTSTRLISAHDTQNEIRIAPTTWHEWRRAPPTEAGPDVIVEQRTDPPDGAQAVFLWNLNGTLLTAGNNMPCPPYMPRLLHKWLVDAWVLLSQSTLFDEFDHVPVLVNVQAAFAKRGFAFGAGTLGHGLLRTVEWVISHMLLFLVSRCARILGIAAVRARFTPDEARQRWASKADAEAQQEEAKTR